jgi:hypothetical protein
MRSKLITGAVLVVLALGCLGGLSARSVLTRLFPITHEGEVERIAQFRKGFGRQDAASRQNNQFALLFTDGFQCEGHDTSFAVVKAGDRIQIRAYHDVRGWPLLDPEWWECDEAQLVSVDTQR